MSSSKISLFITKNLIKIIGKFNFIYIFNYLYMLKYTLKYYITNLNAFNVSLHIDNAK